VKIRTADGDLIPGHKTILACRSTVLANMVDHEGTINLDISTPVLTSLLQYIYTDRVDPLNAPQPLLKFAVNLDLPGLKVREKWVLIMLTLYANVKLLFGMLHKFKLYTKGFFPY